MVSLSGTLLKSVSRIYAIAFTYRYRLPSPHSGDTRAEIATKQTAKLPVLNDIPLSEPVQEQISADSPDDTASSKDQLICVDYEPSFRLHVLEESPLHWYEAQAVHTLLMLKLYAASAASAKASEVLCTTTHCQQLIPHTSRSSQAKPSKKTNTKTNMNI